MKIEHACGKLLIGVAAAVLALGVGVVRAEEKAALDGKTFSGQIGEKGKTADDKDDLVFKDGRFRSTGCDSYGFGDAPYKAEAKGEVVAFEAETTSAKEGKILWKGTVKGDAAEATFLWTKPGKAPIEYWFKGALKK